MQRIDNYYRTLKLLHEKKPYTVGHLGTLLGFIGNNRACVYRRMYAFEKKGLVVRKPIGLTKYGEKMFFLLKRYVYHRDKAAELYGELGNLLQQNASDD